MNYNSHHVRIRGPCRINAGLIDVGANQGPAQSTVLQQGLVYINQNQNAFTEVSLDA